MGFANFMQVGFLVLLCLCFGSARRVLIDSKDVDKPNFARSLEATETAGRRSGDAGMDEGDGKFGIGSGLGSSKWQSGGKGGHCAGGGGGGGGGGGCGGGGGGSSYCNWCGFGCGMGGGGGGGGGGGCGTYGGCGCGGGGNIPGGCYSPPPITCSPVSCQPVSNCCPVGCQQPASYCCPVGCPQPASNCYPAGCQPGFGQHRMGVQHLSSSQSEQTSINNGILSESINDVLSTETSTTKHKNNQNDNVAKKNVNDESNAEQRHQDHKEPGLNDSKETTKDFGLVPQEEKPKQDSKPDPGNIMQESESDPTQPLETDDKIQKRDGSMN